MNDPSKFRECMEKTLHHVFRKHDIGRWSGGMFNSEFSFPIMNDHNKECMDIIVVLRTNEIKTHTSYRVHTDEGHNVVIETTPTTQNSIDELLEHIDSIIETKRDIAQELSRQAQTYIKSMPFQLLGIRKADSEKAKRNDTGVIHGRSMFH
jgi:hypothetical protein